MYEGHAPMRPLDYRSPNEALRKEHGRERRSGSAYGTDPRSKMRDSRRRFSGRYDRRHRQYMEMLAERAQALRDYFDRKDAGEGEDEYLSINPPSGEEVRIPSVMDDMGYHLTSDGRYPEIKGVSRVPRGWKLRREQVPFYFFRAPGRRVNQDVESRVEHILRTFENDEDFQRVYRELK